MPHNKGTETEPERLQIGLVDGPQQIDHFLAHLQHFAGKDQEFFSGVG
jgi:hypothetical protein